jgi:hypothetical protein
MLVVPDWIEAHCVIPDGFRRGQQFRLYDYQLEYFAAFYSVKLSTKWVPSDPILAPAFLYRRGLLVGPQKLGKGPHTAAHVCAEGVGPVLFAGWAEGGEVYDCRDAGCGCGWEYEYEPGEPMGMAWPTPLIQITAVSEEQTDNIYGALRPMIDQGPLADLIPKTGEEMIRLPGGGRVDVVTSSAQSRLGQRVTFVPQDEVGLWTKTNKMIGERGVADTQYRGLAGMGGRASLTTNGWDPAEQSLAQREFESPAQDVYRQMKQAPAALSYGNRDERRRIHRIVYGETLREHGGHIDLDSIEAEALDLIHKGERAQAERFFGNRIVTGGGSWLRDGLWESTAADIEVPDGTPICLGFDGSDVDDWTALRAETFDGHRFTPTYGPDHRKTIWNPAEWDGKIPRAEVHAAMDEIFGRYKVKRLYADPPDWRSEVGDWAGLYGEEIVVEWPTYRVVPMHAALERSVTDLSTGRSTHDRCEVTARHIANARRLARPGQRYILGKPTQQQKIDAAMADTLAHEAAADAHADDWTATPTPSKVFVFRR